MKPEWQSILRSPLGGEALQFEGTCASTNLIDWGDGFLVTPKGIRVAAVRDGIPDFVQSTTWAIFDRTKAAHESLVESGWKSQQAFGHEPVVQSFMADILSAGPLIVEIGAGPGGGHMPMILERHPDATVLVNDFERRMLAEWRSFFNSTGLGRGVSFACFDACSMPLASSSVDCVSSHGCLSNIKAHRDLAVKEAFRVLRPGGLLAIMEGQIVQPTHEVVCDMLDRSDMADPWMLIPGLVTGWVPLLELVGFTVTAETSLVRKALIPEDGDLGRLAQKHGTTIEVEYRLVEARKPIP